MSCNSIRILFSCLPISGHLLYVSNRVQSAESLYQKLESDVRSVERTTNILRRALNYFRPALNGRDDAFARNELSRVAANLQHQKAEADEALKERALNCKRLNILYAKCHIICNLSTLVLLVSAVAFQILQPIPFALLFCATAYLVRGAYHNLEELAPGSFRKLLFF